MCNECAYKMVPRECRNTQFIEDHVCVFCGNERKPETILSQVSAGCQAPTCASHSFFLSSFLFIFCFLPNKHFMYRLNILATLDVIKIMLDFWYHM